MFTTFNMRGGIITGNTARESGGGVYSRGATFTKTGGIITGYTSDQTNGNVARDDGYILGRRGHAVYVNENQRKETTAGTGDNMSSRTSGAAGGWD
jgi:predicted outer membrane repeat protein